MIAEVEAGNVSAVIVKDMSRFGRDYLKVGFYTEVMFKEKGVRFIAINNGIDSANQQDSDFTPFLNIMNEWYARDASRKIQAVFKSRMQDGKRVSPSVPYGYLRSPEDKQKLIIDEEPAAVVRRIYQMVIEGKGITAIADILTAEKVLIPSAYAKSIAPKMTTAGALQILISGLLPPFPISLKSRNTWGIRYWERQSASATRPRSGARQSRTN